MPIKNTQIRVRNKAGDQFDIVMHEEVDGDDHPGRYWYTLGGKRVEENDNEGGWIQPGTNEPLTRVS